MALALATALLLIAVDARTARLIPLFTIGVFIGFTLSQLGLVRHWVATRASRWRARAAINGIGAALTAMAVVVALVTKFLAGAWVVAIAIPLLILTFARIENYYNEAGAELQRGQGPPRPRKHGSLITPVSAIDRLTEQAVSAALSMGETVIALAIAGDELERTKIKRAWDEWDPGVPLEVLVDPHRSLIRTVLRYIRSLESRSAVTTVLISEIVPSQAHARDPSLPARAASCERASVKDRRRGGHAPIPAARLMCLP